MFHISSPIVLFSYGKVKDIFGGIRIKFLSGEGKGKEWDGCMRGRSPKWGVVYFAKFPLLSKKQTLSHKLFIRQTSNHHHCNWHAQKPACQGLSKWFQAVLPSQKQLCVFLRNKYGFQIGNAMDKITVLILSLNKEALSPSFSLNTLCMWLTVGG